MQWVASTLHTTSEHGVSSITTADAHTSAASSQLNWRPPADLNGLANAVGSQYPSHYLGTWCIQHYYRWWAHLGCQQSTEMTPTDRFKWTRPFRAKDDVWFLRVCHHISTGLYVRFLQQHPVYKSPQSSTLNPCASRIAVLFRDANAYGSSDKLYYGRRHSVPVDIKPKRPSKFRLL